ncbi:Protein of unknown function [Gryllus bimaculatus]|nr:Protein of unknown function [Gryllus bimaculatus]
MQDGNDRAQHSVADSHTGTNGRSCYTGRGAAPPQPTALASPRPTACCEGRDTRRLANGRRERLQVPGLHVRGVHSEQLSRGEGGCRRRGRPTPDDMRPSEAKDAPRRPPPGGRGGCGDDALGRRRRAKRRGRGARDGGSVPAAAEHNDGPRLRRGRRTTPDGMTQRTREPHRDGSPRRCVALRCATPTTRRPSPSGGQWARGRPRCARLRAGHERRAAHRQGRRTQCARLVAFAEITTELLLGMAPARNTSAL